MSDQDTGANEAGNAAPTGQPQQQALPSIGVLTQYVKDLSFENPHAPRALTQQTGNPRIEIAVNVVANPIGTDTFEVDLTIDAKAKGKGGENDSEDVIVFATDLTYGGVFRIQNVAQESLHPLVMIECPRILFPFARQVIAEATRNGGFPPLLIDPIDFSVLYRQKLAQQAQAAAKAAENGGGSPVEGHA
ncbi:MAG: protein-export chaperone SecB [Rhodobiaceae bacterium]|nr:protein-export chaperone SecB [Rhodobiaceae bacterium]